jgi:hypothetical protein
VKSYGMAIPANWNHALNMLPHLAKCAKERRTITYGELANLIGHSAYYLGGPLDVLRDEILERHRLPRLDALVVNQDAKEAGESFIKGGRHGLDDETYHDLLEDYRQKVFEYPNWEGVVERLVKHYRG